jgi:para-nitrobenzyl esterase
MTQFTRRAWFAAAAGASAATWLPPVQAGARHGSARLVTGRSETATRAGTVRGFVRDGVHVFRGIPYAGAPVGEHRFRRAPPPTPWNGVRNCYGYGPTCPRAGGNADASQLEWALLVPVGPDTVRDEDCLRVNVWTQGLGDGRRRPVLVWLHSQGFGGGSSQEFLANDGENLARRHDVVVVTVNHRVGILGFFGFDDAAANVGMLDLVDALRWVRANAEAFGGDPECVTIAGQSGGGFKTSVLLAMPEARGLFHRAIVQSGSRLRVHTRESMQRLARMALDELGLAGATRERLVDVPADALVKASLAAAQRIEREGPAAVGFEAPASYWQPTAGIDSLPVQPCDPDAPSTSRDVPLLVGSTREELNAAIQQPALESLGWTDFDARVAAALGRLSGAAIEAARSDHPHARPIELLNVLDSRRFRMSAIAHAERFAQRGAAPAYLYRFDWRTPVFDGRPRAFHTCDICFVFLNTDACDTITGGGARPRALAERIAAAWVAFARTGRPSAPGLPAWPAHTIERRDTMLLDDGCVVVRDPEPALRRLFGTAP